MLGFMGSGTVKGFATMFMVTIFCTFVFNVWVSRFLLNQLVKSGKLDDKKTWFGVKMENIPDFNKNQEAFYEGPFKKIDFVKRSKVAIVSAIVILVCALGLMLFHGVSGNGALNLGIDFSSGTKITVTADTAITVAEVEAEFEQLGIDVSRKHWNRKLFLKSNRCLSRSMALSQTITWLHRL